MFTKIELAKEATTITASVLAAKVIASTMTSLTDLDEDGIPVRVAAPVGGWMVANHFRAQTDAAVEWAAAKLETIRDNRNANKKDDSQSETP
jgi:methanogenic corrinoid protein MtbC1